MPKWRNGRRAGLKNRWGQPRVSSTLTFGTTRLGTNKPRRPKSAGLPLCRCAQIVLKGVLGLGRLHFPLEQICDGGRMRFFHTAHYMGIQIHGDADGGVT